MIALRKGVRGLAVLSSVTLLAACGGGGGGGGSGGPDLTLDNDNLAEQTVEVGQESDVSGILGLQDDIDTGQELILEVMESIEAQHTGSSSTINCEQGGTATVTDESADGRIDEKWLLQDCVINTQVLGSVSLSGDYRFVASFSGDEDADFVLDGFETYGIEGMRLSTSDQINLRGRADFDYSKTGNSIRFIDTASVFEFKVGDLYVAITDAETRLEGNDVTLDFTTKGKLIGSAIGGYIQLSTPQVVKINNGEACPASGILRVASNGVAEILFGTSTEGTGDAVQIRVDGQIVDSSDDCSAIGFIP
ncbi:hypothetical protein [Marinobacter sp. LQ44]|uniref:hypothetical protein n=1 Tax=unclassified Marinobacter TaxID=83889 RepID=UPI000AF24440|nr:hypothetical protein [Marinobacter sp. LQ44]